MALAAAQADFGLYGLAVMGQNLARNIAGHGYSVAVANRTASRTDGFLAEHGSEGVLLGARDLAGLAAAVRRPRPIMLMVKAGPPVDEAIEQLLPHLDEGDVVIDGGNSHFSDTRRRFARLRGKDIQFLGTGVSGGEEGALKGPSIMPGGTPEAYAAVERIFSSIAAQVDGTPCSAYIGADGAGHYVKMVHNGIEYADMQLIAEAYQILRSTLGTTAGRLAEIFAGWNRGDLQSYLIQITAEVLGKRDGEGYLVDSLLDQAEQKGTGRWTSQSALDLGIPVTGITEAVFARSLSALKGERVAASTALAGPGAAGAAPEGLVEDVRQALYASKIVAYAQGFQQLRAAAGEYGWDLRPGTLATIWRGGCIIRARFLDRIREAHQDDPGLANLLLAPYFADAVARAQPAWRRVVAFAVQAGIAVPAFASTLAYYDGYRAATGPANLIQGLRDYFGAHTYRRLDREGYFHTRWGQDGREVQA